MEDLSDKQDRLRSADIQRLTTARPYDVAYEFIEECYPERLQAFSAELPIDDPRWALWEGASDVFPETRAETMARIVGRTDDITITRMVDEITARRIYVVSRND